MSDVYVLEGHFSEKPKLKAWEIDVDGYLLYEKIALEGEMQDFNTIFVKPPLGLSKPKWDRSNNIWTEGKSEEDLLYDEQTLKMQELSTECNKTILGRFSVTVEGVEYQFSNDMEAQSNFEKCDRAFEKGRATEIPWTAYDVDGNVVRVLLNDIKFEPVYVAHLTHIQNNISKLRDFLEPQVWGASTVEEVRNIIW
jgi:hypothetical protein